MVAQQDSDGAIFAMRERCVAMAVEIAGTLTVLAEAAANAPPKVRDATLTAISEVAAAQERLSDETRRMPGSSVEQFALMQDVLQAQRGTLIELVLIVKQLGVPVTGLFAGGGKDTQLARYQPSAAQLASPELRRAVFVSRRVRANAPERFPNRGAISRIERRWRSWSRARARGREERRAARAHRASNRQFSRFFRAAVSWTLGVVIVIASGLLIAYGTFPRAGDPEPTAGRLGLAPRTLAAAKPLPVPRGEPSLPPQRTALVSSPDANTRIAMRDPVSAAARSGPPTSPPQDTAPSMAPIPTSGISFSAPIPVEDGALGAPAPEARPLGPVVPAKAESVPERTMLADVTPPTKTSDPEFVAVLFTHKEQAVIERYFSELQRRFPAQLLHRKVELQAVDMGEKGVWHRLVLLPPGSREQADTICQTLMAGGYDRCWVKNY